MFTPELQHHGNATKATALDEGGETYQLFRSLCSPSAELCWVLLEQVSRRQSRIILELFLNKYYDVRVELSWNYSWTNLNYLELLFNKYCNATIESSWIISEHILRHPIELSWIIFEQILQRQRRITLS